LRSASRRLASVLDCYHTIVEADRWLGLDLRHLIALKAIADEGSFGRAAEKLGYTQSAISQQIATLERIVGLRLIERPGGPRPISLTEAGRILLRHADAIQARLLAAKADMSALEAGDAGRLRVGTFQSVGAKIIPRLLRRFSESHPQVEVVLRESQD
jgi:molybdate transport repressor ModE-like protein